MKSRECDGAPLGPGAANDDQGRFVVGHAQTLPDRGVGHRGTDDVVGFLQWRDRGQVGAGRDPGKILVEAGGRKRREDVPILDLYRLAVLVMHEQQVEHVRALLDLQRLRDLAARMLARPAEHGTRVTVPTIGDLVGDVATRAIGLSGTGLSRLWIGSELHRRVQAEAEELDTEHIRAEVAAGRIPPAKVLVIGAGVAGLQAIASARRLGAVVSGYDVRPAVKEQVESLGAKFVEVEGAREDAGAGGYAVEQTEEFRKKQMEAIHRAALASDVVIATAQIPGRKAPVLIISGDDDRNVMIGQSIDLKNKLGSLGVYNEVLVFPDEVHGFLRYDSWFRAFEATASFFDRFLRK